MQTTSAPVVTCVLAVLAWSGQVNTAAMERQTAASPTPASQAPSPTVIIIPPATIGMAAASEELQRALDESILPTTVPDLLVELGKRADDVRDTIAKGAYGQVWVPAMATKTVALVLESHMMDFPGEQRSAIAVAVRQIVTAAWELDTYGDLGNREKLGAAYGRLAMGVSTLKEAR
jgi:hypothetical protein